MKDLIKAIIPLRLRLLLRDHIFNYFDLYAIKSYSQEGEDMILRRIFENVPTGFYVDIGAHHPKRFSNTYFFYKKGWSGINIDAKPGSMKLFNKIRPRDINIEAAVADGANELIYYMFNEPALNTFDQNLAMERTSETYCITEEIKILSKPLSLILSEKLPANTKIDFMSIDAEGFDLAVAKSNDWKLFRPEYVLIECLCADMSEIHNSEIADFLFRQGYGLFGKSVCTLIFKDKAPNNTSEEMRGEEYNSENN